MILSKASLHLLDVNSLIALLDEEHIHHEPMTEWFDTPGLQWAVCPLTEAGFLRHMTRPQTGNLSMREATGILERFAKEPGYHYQSIAADWRTLTQPFFRRLQGHNQITDAYLLGLAVREGMTLVTFDRGILHVAGEHGKHVHLLEAK